MLKERKKKRSFSLIAMLLMLLLPAMNVFEISGVAEPIAPPVMQQKFSVEAVSVGVMPSRARN